jgi:hypothetical protein
MLPVSSCLYFFLSCALSLFSLKTLTGQLSKNPSAHLRLQPPPQPLARKPLPPVCARYQFARDLLPPPTPVSDEKPPPERYSDTNYALPAIVVITVTLRILHGSRVARCVDKTPDSCEPQETSTELSFLAFYALLARCE